ncbi:MAG: hypothetical protein LBV30_05800, partial [Propionibacteriaceae bacterium]|nr:hypothetical protein [Propionibacteriaceae bacterium]
MVARAQLVTVLGSDDGLLSQVVADLFDMGMRVRWAAGTPADFPHLISIRDSLGRSAEDFDLRPMASSKGEWAALMAGATYVLAGPVPWPIGRFVDEVAVVQRRSDWIKRLMTTARHCGVRRVLLISGPAAVAGGHRGRRESFTEDDWSV